MKQTLFAAAGWRFGVWPALGLVVLLSVSGTACRPNEPDVVDGDRVLNVIEDDDLMYPIRKGERWSRVFDVDDRQFLYLIVEQHGADVAVHLSGTLEGGGQAEEFTVDTPNGAYGHEEVVAILEPGRHRIEVTSSSEAPGEFLVRTVAFRSVSPGDTDHVGADRSYHRGRRLQQQGELGQAIGVFRDAIEVWERQGRSWREVMTLDEMAMTLMSSGESQAARAVLDDAIRVARGMREQHERQILANLLIRAGAWERTEFQQPSRAIRYFDEAELIAGEVGDVKALSDAAMHRAQAQQDLGHLQLALDDLAVVIETSHSLRDRMNALNRRAVLFLALHAPDEAIDAMSKAGRLVEGSSASMAQFAVGAWLEARAYAQKADLDKARSRAEAGLETARSAGEPKLLTNILRTLGDIERRRGDLASARSRFDEAMELSRSLDDLHRIAVLNVELGYLDLLGGDPDHGLHRIDSAREAFRRLGAMKYVATAQARSAEALRDLGRLDEAATRIEAAFETVEQLRADTDREDLRVGFFAFRQEYFDIALDIEVRRWIDDPGEEAAWSALQVHERRLAIEAGEALRRNVSGRGRRAAESEDDAERHVMTELAALLRNPGIEPTERSLRVDRLYARLAEIRAADRIDPRETNRSKRFDPRSVLEVVDRETAVLVYALGSDESIVWSLSKEEGLHLHRLFLGRRELADRLSAWRRALLSGRPSDRDSATEMGRSLARDLLPPSVDLEAFDRLLLVPDGALHALPFAALVVGPSQDGVHPNDARSQPRYLTELLEVTSLPSLAHLALLRALDARRPEQMRPAAVFADAVYTHKDPRLDPTSSVATGSNVESVGMADEAPTGSPTSGPGAQVTRVLRSLGLDSVGRLAASRREAQRLVEMVPAPGSWMANGFDASKTAVLEANLQPYGILHFAVHGLVDVERPDLSGLVLSRFDSEGRAQDSFLYGFEIGTLSITADLVVLSACETGRGRLVRGEGVLGLTRRFFDAGAARVLSSLWRVSDQQTARLMERFYEHLLIERLGPSAALRQTQLDLLSERATADPYYWAGFFLQGDWRRPKGW